MSNNCCLTKITGLTQITRTVQRTRQVWVEPPPGTLPPPIDVPPVIVPVLEVNQDWFYMNPPWVSEGISVQP